MDSRNRHEHADAVEAAAELPRLPVGIEDFAAICRKGYYYVDKTLLIKRVLDAGSSVTLLTRPRRFGKSLNLDMLRTFFEISREDTARCFKDKKIWQCGPKYTDEQGRYPVIHVSLLDARGLAWETTYERILESLKEEYRRQKKLLGASDERSAAKMELDSFIYGSPGEARAGRSIRMLSEILHDQYGVPPIILIDEYDVPLEAAWTGDFYRHMVDFMRALLTGGLKGNRNMSFACLTGVLRVAKEDIFSGLNHLDVYGVLDKRYDEYFGFTLDEVREMARVYGAEDKFGEIEQWYEGYHFGDQEVFNPWSVICYFSRNCKPAAYWVNTSSNDVIRRVMWRADGAVAQGLTDALNGGTIWSTLSESLGYPDIDTAGGESAAEAAYTLLLMAGYLTTTGRVLEAPEAGSSQMSHELVIPNLELRQVFRKEILEELATSFGLKPRMELESALVRNDPVVVEASLTKLLMQSVSFHDLTNEQSYHVWLLGLLASMPGYRMISNREAGRGRFDICLYPDQTLWPGIIIEVKHGKGISDEKLEELAGTALKQIREQKYVEDLRFQGVERVLLFGIAFTGKKARAISDSLGGRE